MFILERGFDQAPSLGCEVWDLVQFHRWKNFYLLPKVPTVIPVVMEFYSNLKFGERDRVYVKNLEVDIFHTKICEYHGVPFYENDDIELLDLTHYRDVDIELHPFNKNKEKDEEEMEKENDDNPEDVGDFEAVFAPGCPSAKGIVFRSPSDEESCY
ncbi:hypothetical protein Gorai_021527 [Gossypium raimondii]|uniref:Uncharacterized protein n=1 Tax=Gossypium raimondii TaxID=29730 RepID=A0A7J8NQR7_GOSRA|nr:hypothetical protein [Gossypium raimondii]